MDRVTELRSLIIRAKQAYYFGGNPVMSDEAYDLLETELSGIDPNDPALGMTGCPIPPDHILEKAEHKIHMGSQDKVNSEEEFRKWYAKKARGGRIHASIKGDGGSVGAYYEDGYLVQAISRGDGTVGEDITSNVLKFKGLPAYIATDKGPFNGSIRFEAILTKADWTIVGGKNPRNQGNGILGRKDGAQSEYITAFCFDVSNGIEFQTETEKSQYLESIGANVMPWQTFDTPEEVAAYFNNFVATRDDMPFEADGIVLKADDLGLQAELGLSSSGKYHEGQVAWKPESLSALTKLVAYVITGGHQGSIVPNARLEPVDLGGVTISRALLNNFDEVNRLGLAIGDTVRITRRGDVIPKVEEVVEEVFLCPECEFRGTLAEQAEHHGCSIGE